MNISQELIDKVHNKLVILWAERIPQLATLDEAEKQERIMAKEIIELVLGTDTITLTIKEVREAREDTTFAPGSCGFFLHYESNEWTKDCQSMRLTILPAKLKFCFRCR